MITIDQEKCIGCSRCVRDCYPAYLSVSAGKAIVTGQRCMLCGHCVAICPQDAIVIDNTDQSEIVSCGAMVPPEALRTFMQSRRSVRQFMDKPVPHELLKEIIEAGRFTPTGSNSQSVRYIILEEKLPQARALAAEALHRQSQLPEKSAYSSSLQRIYNDHLIGKDSLFHGAPAVIVIADDQPTGINGALAASRMELMVNSLGLGACFVGFFILAMEAEPALRTLLALPDGCRAITTLAIGYPAVAYERTVPRKPAQVTWL